MKVILLVLIILVSFFLGKYVEGHRLVKKLRKCQDMSEKHLTLVRFYDIWMMVKQKGGSIEKYLLNNNIYSVAIYGMSYLGIRLFYELKDSEIQVKYGIDRNKVNDQKGLKIISFGDEMEKVDAIIVTAFMDYDNICESFEGICNYKMIPLDEIIYNII